MLKNIFFYIKLLLFVLLFIDNSNEDMNLSDNIEEVLEKTASILKVHISDVTKRLKLLLLECVNLEKQIKEISQQIDTEVESPKLLETQEIDGVLYLPKLLEGMPAKELKSLADDLKKQIGSGIIALVSVINEKCSIVVGVTDDLTHIFDAVDLVRAGSFAVGGKGGGGRADMAQAGGPSIANAEVALKAIKNIIIEKK